ncbi:MAG TPA: hypothetical protein VFV99_17960 [Kofleriaceae bacterium]|nr:hypothetical protein [Kofleriaceae bacterium]
MTITRRHRRTARKLVLPLIAVGLMTMMMYLHSGSSTQQGASNVTNALYSR